MSAHKIRLPGPEHPITIQPSDDRVTVRAGGATIARSTSTLVLREADYPPVRYIPLADVDRARLRDSDKTTHCPYKGRASYFSIVDLPQGEDAVWCYEDPHPAVEPIRGHVAFYPDRVQIDVEPAGA
jgi:uncharacterized protein (DUF427 family)